jgi:hypothetical protein
MHRIFAALAALSLVPPTSTPEVSSPAKTVCQPVPVLKGPLGFGPGERLDFDIDALGAKAGKLSLRVLSASDGALPVEARVETNSFFSKVRRVNGVATSYLNPRTLRPIRYVEDGVENGIRKHAEVSYQPKERLVRLRYRTEDRPGEAVFPSENDVLDAAGAIYLIRQLPFKEGKDICFDIYGIRKLWRLSGRMEGKERLSLPLGEFEAWHLSGTAVRLDDPKHRREIHVWISNDKARLPLVAVGVIDLGAVRATLNAVHRPGEKSKRAEGQEALKW